jgi:Xaa-Pro aminopeptidase
MYVASRGCLSNGGCGGGAVKTDRVLFTFVAGSVLLFEGLRAEAQPSARREKLYDRLGGGIALLLAEADFSTNWQAHRYDPSYTDNEFKQEVHFLYLTGLGGSESNAVLLVDGARRTSDLYMLQVSEEKRKALLAAGFTQVKPRSELVSDLGALAGRKPDVYLLLGREDFFPFPKVKILPEGLDEPTDRQHDFADALKRRFDWMTFRNLDPILTEMRSVKDADEIATIRKAVEVSSLSLLETLRSVRPGIRESQLAGVARFACRDNGAEREAYSEDLQSGPNFMKSFIDILSDHDKLDRVMESGEVMLVDLSCEYHYYKTDLARTAPVSGKFTPEQRALYDLYLVAYRAALAAVRPGATQRDIALASVEALKKELPRLADDVLRRGVQSYIERHENGAPLGHYVDYYVGGAGDAAKPLVPGQVFVIEPVMKLPDRNNFRVTLEDMILVTETGHEVLSGILPMDADAIEKIIAERGVLDSR